MEGYTDYIVVSGVKNDFEKTLTSLGRKGYILEGSMTASGKPFINNPYVHNPNPIQGIVYSQLMSKIISKK